MLQICQQYLKWISQQNPDGKCHAKQFGGEIRRQVLGYHLLYAAPIDQIARDAEGAENDGDKKNGRVQERWIAMTVP
jgi:hypothetical protein